MNYNILVSGFPRTIKQAEILHQEEKVHVVISLDVPEGWISASPTPFKKTILYPQ